MSGFRPDPIDLTVTTDDRVHNAIKQRIADFTFRDISYASGLRSTEAVGTQKAKTILVRPQTSAFQEAHNRGCGGRLQERFSWTWIAIVAFDRQVDTGSFESLMLRDPIRIPRDADLDQQLDISLLDAEYKHPPEKQSSHGTRVTYRFQVDLTPL